MKYMPASPLPPTVGAGDSFYAAEGLNTLTNATHLSSKPVCQTHLTLHKVDSNTGCYQTLFWLCMTLLYNHKVMIYYYYYLNFFSHEETEIAHFRTERHLGKGYLSHSLNLL